MSEWAMVLIGLGITAVGLFGITLAPSYEWLYVVGPVVAIGNGLSFPSFTSLYSQTCQARDAGELLGQGNSMGIAGRVVGALCAGLLMDYYALETPFVVAAVLMVAASMIFAAAHNILVPGSSTRDVVGET
jgi:MFS family permease